MIDFRIINFRDRACSFTQLLAKLGEPLSRRHVALIRPPERQAQLVKRDVVRALLIAIDAVSTVCSAFEALEE